MGYRSEVGLAITKDVYETAPEEVKKFLESDLNKEETEEAVLFYANYIKWYEEDMEVRATEKWLESLKLDNFDDYMFIRIGEDISDLEEHGGFCDNPWELRYSRQLVFNRD